MDTSNSRTGRFSWSFLSAGVSRSSNIARPGAGEPHRLRYFNAAQLKTNQEIITLSVFVIFSVFYLREAIHWKQIVGFAFIALGAFFIFTK